MGEVGNADLLEERERLMRIASIDIDSDHLEIGAAKLAFELVESRHFAAAWHAPGGPEVEEHGTAVPIVKLSFMPLGVLEGDIGEAERRARHGQRRQFALR